MTGPLAGVHIVEVAGLGPAPFAAMVLADLGADVVRIERPGSELDHGGPVLNRGRPALAVDLKAPAGRDLVLRLVERADGLIEGLRPGVMERLGLGPDLCAERNPRLVYGRMTGWGQDGPLAHTAGHDINFISLAGVLRHIGRRGERPVPPLNLVADFGGGGMLLVVGMLAGIIEAKSSGRGQVIDAAMVDGSALLMAMVYGWRAQGLWDPDRNGENITDTGRPFYDVYETADGGFVGVGPLEPRFYGHLLAGLGLDAPAEGLPDRDDPGSWDQLRLRFAEVFRTRTREAWAATFADTDACVTPLLSMDEAARHPHLADRGTVVAVDGVLQPAPAPRFSRTPAELRDAATVDAAAAEALAGWGITPEEVADLRVR